jgi:hypothetical protein
VLWLAQESQQSKDAAWISVTCLLSIGCETAVLRAPNRLCYPLVLLERSLLYLNTGYVLRGIPVADPDYSGMLATLIFCIIIGITKFLGNY